MRATAIVRAVERGVRGVGTATLTATTWTTSTVRGQGVAGQGGAGRWCVGGGVVGCDCDVVLCGGGVGVVGSAACLWRAGLPDA